MKLTLGGRLQTFFAHRLALWIPWMAALYILWQTTVELSHSTSQLLQVFYPLVQALRGQSSALETFLTTWGLTSLELLLMGLVLALGLLLGLETVWPAFPKRLSQASIAIRTRRRPLSYLLALTLAAFPTFLLLGTYWGDVFTGPYLRLALLLACGLLAGAFLPRRTARAEDHIAGQPFFLLGIALVGSIFLIAAQLITINNYPFPLTWSEGNRLYEYSLYFGKDRYINGSELTPVRNAAGRYILWGLSFLIPHAPIWIHRSWNAFLSIAPYLALGYALARQTRLSRFGKLIFTLGIFLFLAQGPIYTPLTISALIVVLFVRSNRLILSLAAAAAAGFYASLSRWTWAPAPPAWAAFIWLLEFKLPQGAPPNSYWLQFFRRLLPAALVAAVGLAGALLANPTLFMPQELSQSTTLAQPLLWRRLLPNSTYPEGILGALLLAGGPLAAVLVWMAAARRWPLNWVQAAAYAGAAFIFLAGGLVISVKIGGGNNLHNLDMFLVTLAILTGLAWSGRSGSEAAGWPLAPRILLVLVIVLSAWSALRSARPVHLAADEQVLEALNVLRRQVTRAQDVGPVLFMDQRQLLTFGQIQNAPVVEDYEKKWMMDQAMAGDQAYFEQFYRDLANRRFSLIITEPLFTERKDAAYAFSEENNAWAHWVAEPLLCYYAPVRRLEAVDIQFLTPRPDPKDCP